MTKHEATDYTVNQEFETGQRVELHPGCDLWARGARFGVVVGRSFRLSDDDEPIYRVQMDATGKTVKLTVSRLRPAF